jgi:hypothetical protein
VIRSITLLLVLVGCDGDKGGTDTSAVEDTGEDTTPVDADGDGASAELDCDDDNAAMYPGATEICDELDNDCDGETDEGYDADADGWTSCGGDCDDSDADISPDGVEVCDGQDNNCDEQIDEGVGETYYADADSDGYGDAGATLQACVRPSGYVTDDTDCDDGSSGTWPGAAELESETDCMADEDADGYGDIAPASGVTAGTDCDDGSDQISPGEPEVCDSIDNNCNGETDESEVVSFDFDDKDDSKSWSLNGDASQVFDGADGYLQLTPAATSKVGTAMLLQTSSPEAFTASFTVYIGGGDSADGMAFVFLTESDPTVLGSNGSPLGCYGLSGYGVEFDTYNSGSTYSDSSSNHVAVMDTDTFTPYATSSTVPTLRGSDLFVEVEFSSGDVDVYIDGTLYISTTITDWDKADELMFGFAGATGGLYDEHSVDDFSLEIPCAKK